jgi:transposase
MEHIDLRKLNNDELYAIRKQVVRLKKQGWKGTEIEDITGVYQTRISQIWQAYQAEGVEGIKPEKSGRKKDTGRRLTAEEEKEIRAVIINKVPEQLKMAGCLWTRAKICAYIKRMYRKNIVPQVISRYLKRWGLTCQRPTKRACGQDIARIERFKTEEYPAIAKRAKAENAMIYWGDETGVDNRENFERGFAEKGKPPVLPLPTKKERVNMISAITNQGNVRFKVYEETMNQKLFIDFMACLVRDSKRKVFFIVDNLRVHHGKLVAAWLEKHKDEIELFFLPPYAPESNPDEYLNHALKQDVHSGDLPRTKKDIKHKIHSFMRRLQHGRDKVLAFFFHKCVVYCSSAG